MANHHDRNKSATPSRELGRLESTLGPGFKLQPGAGPRRPHPPNRNPSTPDRTMSSQRNRQRGSNRNSESGSHGEELQLWESLKAKSPTIAKLFNESSDNELAILDADRKAAEAVRRGELKTSNVGDLDAALRKQVRHSENTGAQLRQMIEEAKILRAVMKAKEEQQEQQTSSSRSATQRAKESAASSSVYDFDGVGDSPVPSPNANASRRMGGGSSSKGDRDSVPPKLDRSTPAAKAGSVEPQGASSSASHLARSKVTFAKGDEVAFRPKPANNEPTDWILGIVQDVRGEGKSRRYKVLDADVEAGNQKDYRTSASNMIAIQKEGSPLAPLENGKIVLALYPNTTTFYKAEVMDMTADGKVNLKFEGEESSNTTHTVMRRYVVEYRG